MHQGRVVELGPPDQVYEAPSTAFAAEFLGAAAKLNGRVRDRADTGLWRVETPIGDLLCRCRAVPATGSPVLVYVRPEDIHVVAHGAAGESRQVEARVQHVSFLGGTIEWRAEANGVSLRGRSLTNHEESRIVRQSVGGTISLSIPVTRCVLASEDEIAHGVNGAPD
jgi:ABC-type Fe3+/spermidine/putrescine transport system ATPase subunit